MATTKTSTVEEALAELQMGRCIMPHEGVFARVLQGGEIHEDDEIQVLEP